MTIVCVLVCAPVPNQPIRNAKLRFFLSPSTAHTGSPCDRSYEQGWGKLVQLWLLTCGSWPPTGATYSCPAHTCSDGSFPTCDRLCAYLTLWFGRYDRTQLGMANSGGFLVTCAHGQVSCLAKACYRPRSYFSKRCINLCCRHHGLVAGSQEPVMWFTHWGFPKPPFCLSPAMMSAAP